MVRYKVTLTEEERKVLEGIVPQRLSGSAEYKNGRRLRSPFNSLELQ
jgi:hypothetical protein